MVASNPGKAMKMVIIDISCWGWTDISGVKGTGYSSRGSGGWRDFKSQYCPNCSPMGSHTVFWCADLDADKTPIHTKQITNPVLFSVHTDTCVVMVYRGMYISVSYM